MQRITALQNYEKLPTDLQEIYLEVFYKQYKNILENSTAYLLYKFEKYFLDYYSYQDLFNKILEKLEKDIFKQYNFSNNKVIFNSQDDDLLYFQFSKDNQTVFIYISPHKSYYKVIAQDTKNQKYYTLDDILLKQIEKILNAFHFKFLSNDMLDLELSLIGFGRGNPNMFILLDIQQNHESFTSFKSTIDWYEGAQNFTDDFKDIKIFSLNCLLFGDTNYDSYVGDYAKLDILEIK